MTKISYLCFSDCSSLSEIEIPGSVTVIEEAAFKNCRSLKQVVVPFGVTEIGGEAFYGCQNLKYMTIPGNVLLSSGLYSSFFSTATTHTTIWEGSIIIQSEVLSKIYSGTLILPTTLQAIRDKNLHEQFNEIYCYATTPPTVLSDNTLSPECKVYVPDASVDAYKVAEVWKQGQILPLSEANQ